MNTITLTISHSSPQQVKLSHLLEAQIHLKELKKLHITLTIAPHTTLSLHDDVTSIQTTIECVLGKASNLLYELKAIEGVEQFFFKHNEQQITHFQSLEKEIIVRLAGAHAHAEIQAACFGSAQQVFKLKTLQDHQAPQANSKVTIKSVLTDQAKLFCHSLIHVNQQAQQTIADQINKNILLSNQARAISIPTLEVLANDVRCKHGAATSQLDNEQIFYAQSRGIDTIQAQQMLIQAFLN